MESPKPASRFPAYRTLGFTFIVPGGAMNGMIAFVGVGAAFLYLQYNQQRKAQQ